MSKSDYPLIDTQEVKLKFDKKYGDYLIQAF